jgi:hypothetical protein
MAFLADPGGCGHGDAGLLTAVEHKAFGGNG